MLKVLVDVVRDKAALRSELVGLDPNDLPVAEVERIQFGLVLT